MVHEGPCNVSSDYQGATRSNWVYTRRFAVGKTCEFPSRGNCTCESLKSWGMGVKGKQGDDDGTEAASEARIAVLQQEIDLIHFANRLYWQQANPSNEARAEYYRKQDRLENIRSELAKLRKA